jgi:hypothetical protein
VVGLEALKIQTKKGDKMIFYIRQKETGTVIVEYGALSEAIECVRGYVVDDINEGVYEPDYYELYMIDSENDYETVLETF